MFSKISFLLYSFPKEKVLNILTTTFLHIPMPHNISLQTLPTLTQEAEQ